MMTQSVKRAEKRPTLLCMLSALFGCIIAIGRRAEWQVPLETAQVQSGLVTYPLDSPMHYFHTKSWSLLNQLAGTILAASGSEFAASMLLEGLVGATSFAGIFLIVYSISRNRVAALLLPMLMYSLSLVGAAVAYPIALLGTDSSYGILGLSYMLLTVGLLGSGYYRSGACLAGISPAIHPTMGAFCTGIALLSVVANTSFFRPHRARLTTWFLTGLCVTFASLGWQLHSAGDLPELAAPLKLSYLKAYIRYHDYHRTAGDWGSPGVALGALAAVLSLLLGRQKTAAPGTKLVCYSIIFSLLAAFTLVIAADNVPSLYVLNILIPWRYTNYANLCILPLCLGILANDTADRHRLRALLFILAISACFAMRIFQIQAENILFASLLLLTLAYTVIPLPDLPGKRPEKPAAWRDLFSVTLILLLCARQVIPGIEALPSRRAALADRTNTPVLQQISERPGILLTAGSMHDIQLVTRRPVLLDGYALDIFPYVLDTAPRFNDILREIYGLDILAPPPDGIGNLGIITYFHQGIWEQRSCREWQAIRKKFAVTDVLTHDMWQLQLPEVARGSGFILYSIPDKTE